MNQLINLRKNYKSRSKDKKNIKKEVAESPYLSNIIVSSTFAAVCRSAKGQTVSLHALPILSVSSKQTEQADSQVSNDSW